MLRHLTLHDLELPNMSAPAAQRGGIDEEFTPDVHTKINSSPPRETTTTTMRPVEKCRRNLHTQHKRSHLRRFAAASAAAAAAIYPQLTAARALAQTIGAHALVDIKPSGRAILVVSSRSSPRISVHTRSLSLSQ